MVILELIKLRLSRSRRFQSRMISKLFQVIMVSGHLQTQYSPNHAWTSCNLKGSPKIIITHRLLTLETQLSAKRRRMDSHLQPRSRYRIQSKKSDQNWSFIPLNKLHKTLNRPLPLKSSHVASKPYFCLGGLSRSVDKTNNRNLRHLPLRPN